MLVHFHSYIYFFEEISRPFSQTSGLNKKVRIFAKAKQKFLFAVSKRCNAP